jgi:thiamine pyrophosphokinase
MPRAIIFVNGEIPNPGAARSIIHPEDIIIAADGGARHALELGVIPAVIIGDLDSLSDAEIRAFTEMGVHILRFPPAKNETDLELSLAHAIKSGYRPILIVAALGGRLDQALGNISLLAAPESIRSDVRLDDGVTEAFFITGKATVFGKAGDTLSLLPWGMPAEDVSTQDLVYPLNQETLLPYRTRGISNQMLAESATISLKRGLLLCIHCRKI